MDKVPRDPCVQDNGVHTLKVLHSLLVLKKTRFTQDDLNDNFTTSITESDAFRMSPLDTWRMRTELFQLCGTLASIYSSEAHIVDYTNSAASSSEIESELHCVPPSSMSRHSLPEALDYSFLSGTLEKGDTIDYSLRLAQSGIAGTAFVRRATVVAIRLELDKSTSVLLNNGDKLIDSLHRVRRVSMRNIYTGQPMWNPVRLWKDISSMYLHPTDHASDPTGVYAAPPEDESDAAPEMVHPKNIPSTENTKAKRLKQKRDRWEHKRVHKQRSGHPGARLGWLDMSHLPFEMKWLNETYRRCVAVGESAAIHNLLQSKTKEEYNKKKSELNKTFKGRKFQKLYALNLLLPLALFWSLFNTATCSAEPLANVDPSHSPQTIYQLERDEKLLGFELKSMNQRIQFCIVCRENLMNNVPSQTDPEKMYKCGACKGLKNDRHYLEKNLHPVWYPRVDGATSFDDPLLHDEDGNVVVRYDIPKELSSLTMSEQLLIRKVAPFVPALHLDSGYYALDGQCIAFPQDISDVCETLPRQNKDLVTFIRKMGNKNTEAVTYKHLRVNKSRVLAALRWLKIHNSEYKNIIIDTTRLAWMGTKETTILRAKVHVVRVQDTVAPKDQQPTVSKTQCVGELEPSNSIGFSIPGVDEDNPGIDPDQASLVKELAAEAIKANQSAKILHFPPHGDTPMK